MIFVRFEHNGHKQTDPTVWHLVVEGKPTAAGWAFVHCERGVVQWIETRRGGLPEGGKPCEACQEALRREWAGLMGEWRKVNEAMQLEIDSPELKT